LNISKSKILATHKCCGVSALINSQKMYDYNNMKLITLLLDKGGVFFDIGANIGSYTLIASEQSSALVYSFEPHPSTFQQLKNNVDLNKRSNVKLFNIAIGAEDGNIYLTDNPGSSTNHIEANPNENTIEIVCRRMDNFCITNKIEPDYVKMDVEGFEFDVIKSFGDMLCSVKLFFVEINGLSDIRSHGQQEIVDYLNAQDFIGPLCVDFDKRIFTDLRNESKEDAIFVSKKFMTEMLDTGMFAYA
jgi:FkbM family methyltransferase